MTIEKILYIPAYTAKLELDNDLILNILETESFRPYFNGTSQSLSNLHELEELKFLAETISSHYDQYMKEIGKPKHKHKIVAMWANRFENGNINYHTHQNSFISGVYYVKQGTPAQQTIFTSPIQEHLMLDENRIISDSALGGDTGSLIMFPSYTPHLTMFSNDRVTISWNIMPTEMGIKHHLNYTKFFI